MNSADDSISEMRQYRLDGETVEALLSGKIISDDAPQGFQQVASLIGAARGPATAGELANEANVVATVTAELQKVLPISGHVDERRKKMFTQALGVKVAAALAAVLLGGGVAAAATGSLPKPVQSAVSGTLSHVGISVPNPNTHPSPNASPHAALGSANASGHANGSPADTYGLCTAYEASVWGGTTTTTTTATGVGATTTTTVMPKPFAQLALAAKAKGETVQQYCATIAKPSSKGSSGRTSNSHVPSGVTTGPPSSRGTGSSSGTGSGTSTSGTSTSGTSNSHVPSGVTTGPPSSRSTGGSSGTGSGTSTSGTSNPHVPSGVTTGPPSSSKLG